MRKAYLTFVYLIKLLRLKHKKYFYSSDKKLQVSNREMASVNNEFMLDFTVHLQRQELPTYPKVASCYAQTIVAAPLNVMLRASKPGVFILQTYNDNDAKKLRGVFLHIIMLLKRSKTNKSSLKKNT